MSNLICSVCGGSNFTDAPVLWPELIDEWEITEQEVMYINRQQGTRCASCGTSLRGIALANAILRHFRCDGGALKALKGRMRVLDINGCDGVSEALAGLTGYRRVNYPNVDMHRLPFADAEFDLVIHSDTLEHVADPRQALRECIRVSGRSGAVVFTIPLIVGRLSRSREGLPSSFHGAPGYENREDFKVRTEFGADFWAYAFDAGASAVTITTIEFPSAQAITLSR